ncbi:MAG TPA: sialidase family protein, partial [Longimicrobiales bacterium]|nr:sialidase family protein [Longimicrobiales bacterium]
DGGESWTRTDFDGMERCIDPWVVVLPGDTALFAAIEIRSDAEGPERFRLNLRRSTDGGRTWSPQPDTLGRRFEHPILAPGGPGHGGALYLGALVFGPTDEEEEPPRLGWVGQLLARPAAGGGHRVEARRTALLGPAPDLIVTGVAPLSDGALVVTYRDFHGRVEGSEEGAAERARSWAVRSDDAGRTFGEPALVDSACASGGLARAFPGYPSAIAGGSTGSSGDLLLHACVRRNLEGVAVSTSSDGGRSWSDPVRVDAGGGSEGTPHARTPMLAAARDGRVAVAWYDRRHDPHGKCQDVYLAVSDNGGERFGPPVRVTTETSCPGAEGNGRAGRSWPMGGDYGALAAGTDGTFHLLWADSRSGVFSLRRAAFRVVGE